MPSVSKPLILEICLLVKDTAKYSGYREQYLRRLLRQDKLNGFKVGQLWLLEVETFEWYISKAEKSQDHRFGPK